VPAIRALLDSLPAIVGVSEAALDLLANLQRLRRGAADDAAIAGERERLRRVAVVDPATVPDVAAAEHHALAALSTTRSIESAVVRRRREEFRWVDADAAADAALHAWETRGEARVEAMRRSAVAVGTWQVAELGARITATQPAAAHTAAGLLATDPALADAVAAAARAARLCPAPPPSPLPAITPGARLAIGPAEWHTGLDDSGWVPTHSAGLLAVTIPAGPAVLIGGPLAVVALDTKRGKQIWRRQFSSGNEGQWRATRSPGGEHRFAQLLADADTVYAADADHILHALDLRTGDDRWTVELAGGLVSTPVLHAGRLHAASRYGEVVALDPRAGARLHARMYGGVTAPLIVNDGLLHLADDDGFLLTLDPRDLALLALTRIGRTGPEAGPVVVAGRLVVADKHGKLTAVDARTGAPRWTRDLALAAHSLHAADDTIVFLGQRGALVALDAATGEPRWTHEYPYDGSSSTLRTRHDSPVARGLPIRHADTLTIPFAWPPALATVDLRTGLALTVAPSPDGASLSGAIGFADGKLLAYTAQSKLWAFTTAAP